MAEIDYSEFGSARLVDLDHIDIEGLGNAASYQLDEALKSAIEVGNDYMAGAIVMAGLLAANKLRREASEIEGKFDAKPTIGRHWVSREDLELQVEVKNKLAEHYGDLGLLIYPEEAERIEASKK